MKTVSSKARHFSKNDYYGYAGASKLPNDDDPYIFEIDETPIQMVLSGGDEDNSITIQVFYSKEGKDYCYGLFDAYKDGNLTFSSVEELEDTFIERYNIMIEKISKNPNDVEKICKLFNLERLI